MAERFANLDFSKTPKQFRQVALEPGYPLLDRTNANARIIAKWLGRMAAEPERRGENIDWFLRSDQGERLDGLAVCPITPNDVKGSLKGEIKELENRISAAEPRTRAEQAVHRSIRENLNHLLEDGWEDVDSYFCKYQDGRGKWRLLWLWGFERIESSFDPTAICGKSGCRALFVNEHSLAGKCPYCQTSIPIPPDPRKRLAMALVLLLILAGAGFGGWWYMQPRATLSGVVLWEGNQQPVQNADIRIEAWDVTAKTDESGQFLLDRLPEGKAEIQITAKGYHPHAQTETLVIGQEQKLKVLLKGNAVLAGHIINGVSKLPLDDAGIRLAGTEITTLSNDDGEFRIEDLPLGKHQIHVAATGFPEQDVDVEIKEGNTTDVSVALIGKGIVSGRVQQANMQPISGAKVELLGTGQTATTDGKGVFVLKELPTGEQRLEVMAQGYVDQRVDVVVEEKERSKAIYLVGAGILSGTITSRSDRKGLAGATVAIEGTPYLTRSDSKGKYSLQGIPAGPVKVAVSADGYRTATFDRVVVAGRSTPLDADLEGGAVLAGVVIDGTNNKPLPNAEVIASVYPSPLSTEDDGTFRLEGVKAGDAELTVSASGFKTEKKGITLKEGEENKIEITVLGDARLRGRVIDAVTKTPIESVELKIVDTVLAGKTDKDGGFEIDGAKSGPARIEVLAKGYPPAMFPERLGGGKISQVAWELKGTEVLTGTVADLGKKPVSGAVATIAGTDVSAKANAQGEFKFEDLPAKPVLLEIKAAGYKTFKAGQEILAGKPNKMAVQLGGDAVLVGKVYDAITNAPVSGATISIAKNALAAPTNARGEFRLENAFGGKNEVVVTHTGYPDKAMTVELVSMKETKEEFSLSGSAIAKGLVLSPEGKPIKGAAVKLPGTKHEAQTDDSGAYELKQLPGGQVTLEIAAEHYKSKIVAGELVKGKTTAFPDVELTSGLDVTGQVISALNGKGLSGLKLKVEGTEIQTESDATGSFTLPAVPVGAIRVHVQGDGYFAETVQVDPAGGEKEIKPVMVPVLNPGEVRMVLLWGDRVKDLDLHLYGSDFHVWAKSPKARFATLDVDNRNGYGPETITIKNPAEGTYQIWVHAYQDPKNEGVLKINQSDAEVRIYQGGAKTGRHIKVSKGPDADFPAWNVGAIEVDKEGAIKINPYGRLNYKLKLP